MTSSTILTPESPGFWDILHNAKMASPFVGHHQYMVVDHNSGLLRPATQKEVIDYTYGGEYDEVLGDDALEGEV